MDARLGSRRKHVTIAAFGKPVALDFGCEATLHPAGHMLGSAQIHLRAEHGTLLYTGDFKTRPNLACERCATPRADVLIMETTFGLPHYVMPPASETIARLLDFCRQALADGVTPVLHAYSLGKTQELVQILGTAGIPVMLGSTAFRMSRLYVELGRPLAPFSEFHPDSCAGHAVIAPQHDPIVQWIQPRRTAAVTGWAVDSSTLYRCGCDAAFPLSDHADFNELLEFVDRVSPRTVYTVHGFARDFAQTLRRRGIEAWALGETNQMELAM